MALVGERSGIAWYWKYFDDREEAETFAAGEREWNVETTGHPGRVNVTDVTGRWKGTFDYADRLYEVAIHH